MGWKSGSELAFEILDIVLPKIDEHEQHDVVVNIMESFQDFDCDTLYELSSLGDKYPSVTSALEELYPERDE